MDVETGSEETGISQQFLPYTVKQELRTHVY